MRRAITRTPLITANLVQDSVLPVSGLDRETTVDRKRPATTVFPLSDASV